MSDYEQMIYLLDKSQTQYYVKKYPDDDSILVDIDPFGNGCIFCFDSDGSILVG